MQSNVRTGLFIALIERGHWSVFSGLGASKCSAALHRSAVQGLSLPIQSMRTKGKAKGFNFLRAQRSFFLLYFKLNNEMLKLQTNQRKSQEENFTSIPTSLIFQEHNQD